MTVFLLPAFNEVDAIGKLIERINEAMAGAHYHVVVVDDGSSDGTGKAAAAASQNRPVTVLTHSSNRGLGRAMKTGIEYICRTWKDTDFLVSMDADNSHPPDLVRDMSDAMGDSADIAIASRFVGNASQIGVPFYRRLLSSGAKIVFRTAFPVGATDYTCGYRMYRISLLKKAMMAYDPFIEATGFVVMVEILLKLSKLSPKIIEIPMVLRYDLKESTSKLRLLRTLMEYLKVLIKVRFRQPQV